MSFQAKHRPVLREEGRAWMAGAAALAGGSALRLSGPPLEGRILEHAGVLEDQLASRLFRIGSSLSSD